MSDRNYNKLFLNTSRAEGSEKLLLGYKHDTKELILAKDKETYFHVPFYTKPLSLKESTLILEGATGAPFPAAADRIFKNQKAYGKHTANGSPSDIVDGTWFCSWLYEDKKGNLKWMDRFYNPGTLKASVAIEQLSEGPEYESKNPVFRDIPSKMIFEPGVMYRYFHMGEKTAQDLVKTFGGVNSERLLLDLNNWTDEETINTAENTKAFLQPILKSSSEKQTFVGESTDVDREAVPFFSFDNNETLDLSLNYNSAYCPINEFSTVCWASSPNWSASQTTQLVGNFSTGGGYGLFVYTLSSFPFFVIPETTSGHLLYLNEENIGYLDKSLSYFADTSAGVPKLVCVDLNHNVILCNSDETGTIYKLDNIGEILCSSIGSNPEFKFEEGEVPCELLCGHGDTIIVRTTSTIYTFDANLKLIKKITYPKSLSAVSAFRYKNNSSFYELDVFENVYDSKFVETTHWYTSTDNGYLYRRREEQDEIGEIVYAFDDVATSFGIDPQNRLWVLHGNNLLSLFDQNAEPLQAPLTTLNVGLNIPHERKNISFVCQYDRSTGKREWRCLIYYSEEYSVFVLDMEANLIDTINLKSMFDTTNIQRLNQDLDTFEFLSKGDFTGYEHKRVFHSLAPYNNSAQLMLRVSLKDKLKQDLSFVQIKAHKSISNWTDNSWHHLAIILRNRMFKVYANGEHQFDLAYSGQYELSFETQPPFFIGSSVGSQRGFTDEVGYPSQIFNGTFQDIKIYDYAIEPSNLKIFIKASWLASNMQWSLPIPSIQYIEKIERMFKNKIPGSKSPLYQITLRGTGIKDTTTRKIIEEQIKLLITDIQPAHVDFLRIHWVD